MIAFIIFMGFISIIVLPTVVWLYALVDVIRNDFKHFSTKIGVIVFTGLTPTTPGRSRIPSMH